jgi:hypothetical protein
MHSRSIQQEERLGSPADNHIFSHEDLFTQFESLKGTPTPSQLNSRTRQPTSTKKKPENKPRTNFSDPKEMTPHTPSPPSVDPRIKTAYMLAQIRRMQKLAKPLGIKVKIHSLKDVQKFLNRIIQLQTNKELEPPEMRTLIDACEVLRKIFQPSEIEEKLNELLQETTTLRATVSQLRKSGSDQGRAGSNTESDSSRSRSVGRTVSHPKG